MALNRPSIINGEPVPYGAAVEDLRLRLKEEGPNAWAAFEALGHTPGNEALQLLCDAAGSADWRYRRCAVEAISDHALTPQSSDVLRGALGDQNLYVVITACRAVAHHRIAEAHVPLLGLLAHAEPTVREAAVLALAADWQPPDFEAVKNLHLWDRSAEVRKKAATALMENASVATGRELFGLWRSSPSGRYRLWAVHLAHQFGGEESRPLWEGFQTDKDGHVRKAVALLRNRD